MNEWIKIILAPVIALCFFIAAMLVYITPGKDKHKELQHELDVLMGKGENMVPIEKIIEQETMTDSLKQMIFEMKERLYPVAEFSELGQDLENSCRKYGLRLLILTPEYSKLNLVQQEDQEITELPITIVMTGSFMEFARYMEQLTEFSYVKATQVNLYRPENNPIGNQIIIEIEGLVIFKNKIQKPADKSELVSAKM